MKSENINVGKIIKYSHGGDYLFLSDKNSIIILDTIYYELIYSFDGHTGLILDIYICSDDTHFVSTCSSGYVFVSNLLANKGI